MKLLAITLINLIAISSIASPLEAVTPGGKKVILNEDGTWEYRKETSQKADSCDFRNANWGMTIEQVKKTESGDIVKEDSKVLAYQDKVAGMDTLVLYIFVEGKLVRAKYAFTQSHSNKNDFLQDYSSLQKIMTNKYGKHEDDVTHWRNDLYKNDYERWGLAVATGKLVKFSSWKTPETEIFLSLSGDNYKIALSAGYSSLKLESLEDAQNQKEAESKL